MREIKISKSVANLIRCAYYLACAILFALMLLLEMVTSIPMQVLVVMFLAGSLILFWEYFDKLVEE